MVLKVKDLKHFLMHFCFVYKILQIQYFCYPVFKYFLLSLSCFQGFFMNKVLILSIAMFAVSVEAGDQEKTFRVKVIPLSPQIFNSSFRGDVVATSWNLSDTPTGVSPEQLTPLWFAQTMKVIYDSQGRKTPLNCAAVIAVDNESEIRKRLQHKAKISKANLIQYFMNERKKLTKIQKMYELQQAREFDDLRGWEKTCQALQNNK